MCPAVGQGALAIETRADGGHAFDICRRLDDRDTRVAVTAERAVLATLGGGCQVPIGAYAAVCVNALALGGVVVSPDGTQIIRKNSEAVCEDAEALGCKLGEELLAAGGRQILDSVYGTSPSHP